MSFMVQTAMVEELVGVSCVVGRSKASFIANFVRLPQRSYSEVIERRMCTSLRKQQGAGDYGVLSDIERIYSLSDLHVDHSKNFKWLKEKLPNSQLGGNDLLLVAGDVSHDLDRIQQTFEMIRDICGCRIMFLPGNHEAWVPSTQNSSSIEKLEDLYDFCRGLDGVLVDPHLVLGTHPDAHPLWLLPLASWYDGSLTVEGCEDLCVDFKLWPWADFKRCNWPPEFPLDDQESPNARIPSGVAQYFHEQNQPHVDLVRRYLKENPTTSVLSLSHFLPNQQCLPDWKDLSAQSFEREWMDHGAPGTSAKFAKVAGSMGLDKQLRTLLPKRPTSEQFHLHVFGHSHRPKDFEYKGIRYAHNPLGNPRERLMYMVAPEVDMQLLWDTSIAGCGHVPAKQQVLRLWEEQGGGLVGLRERLELHGKSRRMRRPRNNSIWVI
eukprot:CAMPEP_0194063440 /NCGR_PEP_ID=MMETSP0009_2-20130614/80323_1 /TAXON_ID=210454 /ORGANISM="Grammatophora oceanica, Strain CCMP 410" /LENGTH=434 /DNA_ID=CAMNT_0038715549 /DNA_START=63 /DNA_END=1368 /DNA_ORIENTATION=-